MKVDPFKHVGRPETWERFGGESDDRADAERRAMGEFFIRRLNKSAKRDHDASADIISGGFVAFAGLFVAAAGGPYRLSEEAFERWIGAATFAYYQAISCFDGPGDVQ